jgi:hypothetical protein
MQFGQYMKELFTDVGDYIVSHPKEAVVYTGIGLGVLLSGCGKKKMVEESLSVGKYVIEDATLGGDKKNYVVAELVGGTDNPPPEAGKDYKGPSDLVFALRDSVAGRMFANNIKGRTIRIVRIRPEGYYTTTTGERRYNAAPGDYEILCDENFRLPCEEKKEPEKAPVKEPVKKPVKSGSTTTKTVAKQEIPPKEKAPDTCVIKHVYEEPPIITESRKTSESWYTQQNQEPVIVNNYYEQPEGPIVYRVAHHGMNQLYVTRTYARPIIVVRSHGWR